MIAIMRSSYLTLARQIVIYFPFNLFLIIGMRIGIPYTIHKTAIRGELMSDHRGMTQYRYRFQINRLQIILIYAYV